jgi:hypothetical protein
MQELTRGIPSSDDPIDCRMVAHDLWPRRLIERREEQTVVLPPAAISAMETLLAGLLSGERVAILTEDQELSPTEASAILGISRPLVVHRMDVGDLPFRYVGKHRRASLKDVLALKAKLDVQRKAMEDLVDDAEDLHRRHGI